MVNSKPVSVSKLDPTGPVWVIVSKSVANLRNIPTKQKLSVANNSSGSYLIIGVATYYHAAKTLLKYCFNTNHSFKWRPG